MISGIYMILNNVTGDYYIGQAVNFEKRKIKHFSKLKKNKHYNPHLQRAYNKYGKENFEFLILKECEPEQLTNYEQWLVDSLNPKYNVLTECVDSMLGFKHSKETKEKMRKPKSEETKLKMSIARSGSGNSMYGISGSANPNYGKYFSEETKKKLSISHIGIQSGSAHPLFGKTHSVETKLKMSIAAKNRRKKGGN